MSESLLPYTLDRPIGIFDSGVGGLTVLKALRRKLPHRDFVYLGDTARVPYGRKPAAMVAEFAYGITEFLRQTGVEGVVIACNTASASALPELAGHFSIPIWGVIEPGVEAAARLTRTGRVGVVIFRRARRPPVRPRFRLAASTCSTPPSASTPRLPSAAHPRSAGMLAGLGDHAWGIAELLTAGA
jgi:hypothetical protein